MCFRIQCHLLTLIYGFARPPNYNTATCGLKCVDQLKKKCIDCDTPVPKCSLICLCLAGKRLRERSWTRWPTLQCHLYNVLHLRYQTSVTILDETQSECVHYEYLCHASQCANYLLAFGEVDLLKKWMFFWGWGVVVNHVKTLKCLWCECI